MIPHQSLRSQKSPTRPIPENRITKKNNQASVSSDSRASAAAKAPSRTAVPLWPHAQKAPQALQRKSTRL